MFSLYLQGLDDLLREGLGRFGPAFVAAQTRFVLARQTLEGGFRGRRGGADPYYTDFALRLLTAAGAPRETLRGAADYLRSLPPMPRDLVDCFSRLNTARLLAMAGVAPETDPEAIGTVLWSQALAGGGFARPGAEAVSAYHTFLGALCCEMLGVEFPEAAGTVERIRAVRCPDGGYADLPGSRWGQTSATAAAVGFLLSQHALARDERAQASGFLTAMQAPDGGFLAHAQAPQSDLLSTFTALFALATLDALGRVNLGAAARFVRELAEPEGGFRGTRSDPEADTEYTYYGVGSLCLLSLTAEKCPQNLI